MAKFKHRDKTKRAGKNFGPRMQFIDKEKPKELGRFYTQKKYEERKAADAASLAKTEAFLRKKGLLK